MSELDKPIGNKEQPKLTAGSVIVKSVEVTSGGEGKKKFKIVKLSVLHPEKEDSFVVSNLKIKKVQGNNETISKDGIWYREDSDGNIDMRCNAALLMKFYNKETLKQFENTTVMTELDSSGYLCIKAY